MQGDTRKGEVIRAASHIRSATAGRGAESHCSLDLMAWGAPYRLIAETPILLERMRGAAPYGSIPCSTADAAALTLALVQPPLQPRFQIWCGEELLAEDESLERILEHLSARLTLHVAEHSPDYVFVHAGVVTWRGRAVILPGASFAGKSTLVRELVRAGAVYYSDEFALIDREGLVHPFPRALRMRRPGRPEQTPISIEQMEGSAGTASAPISVVLFTRFEAESCWAPEQLLPGRAALELLLHTLPVQRTPARVMATFAAVMRAARAWRTPRGEAADAAAALLRAIEPDGGLA